MGGIPPDGRLQIIEGSDPSIGSGLMGGSLIGALVGVLGVFARQIPPGAHAVVLQGDEAGSAAVQSIVAGLDGSLVTRPLDDVLTELEVGREAPGEVAGPLGEAEGAVHR